MTSTSLRRRELIFSNVDYSVSDEKCVNFARFSRVDYRRTNAENLNRHALVSFEIPGKFWLALAVAVGSAYDRKPRARLLNQDNAEAEVAVPEV